MATQIWHAQDSSSNKRCWETTKAKWFVPSLWLGMPTMPKVPGRDALFDARRGSQIERENVSECAGCQDTTPESEPIVRSINGQGAGRTRQPSQHVDI